MLPSGMKPGARDVWGCRLHVWGCRLHARVAGFVGTTSQFYFHYGYLRTANLLLTGVVGVKATLLTTYLLLTHYLLTYVLLTCSSPASWVWKPRFCVVAGLRTNSGRVGS